MCIQEEKFNKFVTDNEEFKEDILARIDNIPHLVLNTPISVKNGETHQLTIQEAIKQNWERTVHISEGKINILVKDSDGFTQSWKLPEIINKLVKRPELTFSKAAKYSDWLYKILKFAEAIGIVYILSYMVMGKQ